MSAQGEIKSTTAIRSPIYWALLGLVIERPSYGYELLKRFEREYGQMLPLSSESHVYRALNVLQGRGLIEEVLTASAGASERQPRPRYQSTIDGLRGYRDWLIARVRQDHRPSRLFARELAVFAREPDVALEIIDCCEQACAGPHAPFGARDDGDADGELTCGLAARLVSEESRLTMQATLPWVSYARGEFEALARARVPQATDSEVEVCGSRSTRAPHTASRVSGGARARPRVASAAQSPRKGRAR